MGSAWFGGFILTSRKILIVEDCGDLLNLLGEALALLGWETILAESGRETMNKLELERDLPSVVLLDMRTPVIGIKLAASLKAHPVYKYIPILAVSGQSRGVTRERCLALGCDDFISKPFALPELEMRLTNILAVERRKAIMATDPTNLESNRQERRSRGAGRRRVA
jgi:two-component system cell cycle response regulator DivK